jgi:hypothetical protein
MILHVTSGEASVQRLKAAGVRGEFLSWLDVLHEGPVPEGFDHRGLRMIRARFISECQWAPYETAMADLERRDHTLGDWRREIALWFEPDLFDQLQLLQCLDRLEAHDDPVWLVTVPHASLRQIGELWSGRVRVSPSMISLARDAWTAFRAPDPREMERLLASHDTTRLPALASAFHRLFEEFPSTRNGLSRSENDILELVASGLTDPKRVFLEQQNREPDVFLGDAAFWRIVLRLRPLLRLNASQGPMRGVLTPGEHARDVLLGHADATQLLPLDRWIGGTHLTPNNLYRWDGHRLVR